MILCDDKTTDQLLVVIIAEASPSLYSISGDIRLAVLHCAFAHKVVANCKDRFRRTAITKLIQETDTCRTVLYGPAASCRRRNVECISRGCACVGV